MKPFIGIKKIWYADPISSVTAAESGYSGTELKSLLSSATEVTNVHNDTWGYEESDPNVTEYINQLTGKPYFRDIDQQGVPTISFTLGEYSFADKAALQGGKATTTTKWERSDTPEMIEKCIVAQTKTGNYIVFPKASIVGKGNFVEKNIGLGISAVALETGVAGLASEIWFEEGQVK